MQLLDSFINSARALTLSLLTSTRSSNYQVTRQLFLDFVKQLIHWFTSNQQKENPDTMALLDAILDGLVDPDNGSLRSFNYLLLIFANPLCDNSFYPSNTVLSSESTYVMLIEINKWFAYSHFGKLYYVAVVSALHLLQSVILKLLKI